MYIISRPSKDRIELRDSKYGEGEVRPEFVGPSPVHVFSLAGWTQLCTLRHFIDVGMGHGLRPGNKYVSSRDTVVERLGPDEFKWNSVTNPNTPSLHFGLIEHEAFMHFMYDGRIRPVEMDEGELGVGHTVTCQPLVKEIDDLQTLFEESPDE